MKDENGMTATPVEPIVSQFYDRDGITIYNADCRDVLPMLGKFDLLLTDPPYGINRGHHDGTICKNPSNNWKRHERRGDWDENPVCRALLKQCFDVTANQIVWGGNYLVDAIRPSMGWIVWDKGQKFSSSDCELAFTSFNKALRRVECNRKMIDLEGALHPTQKPLRVIRFCLEYAAPVKSVLDPFMGSGTTLVAAKLLGLRAVGIEINVEYCRIAVERLRQGVLCFDSEG